MGGGVGAQGHAPAALPPGKISGTYCIGGWVGLRGCLKGAENLAPTGIRFPDRSARSESLHRLRYPGHIIIATPTIHNYLTIYLEAL